MTSPNDKFTQHIQEENTPEFRKFKSISNEDEVLTRVITECISLSPDANILDIGGREGYVSLALVKPDQVTIVDPDPIIDVPKGVRLIREKIQNTDLESNLYDLIIASHVWGDLNRENSDREVFDKLVSHLKPGGCLVMCYNSNTGFMADLLAFAKENLKQMRYDYFDESVLNDRAMEKRTFAVPLRYESFEELGRCCWMLFATAFDDIEETAKLFIPFLKKHLDQPAFDLEETVLILRNQS